MTCGESEKRESKRGQRDRKEVTERENRIHGQRAGREAVKRTREEVNRDRVRK